MRPHITRLAVFFFLGLGPFTCSLAANTEFATPERVRMRPVFLVPAGQSPPTRELKTVWMRHLKWTQQFFKESLSNRDTFEFAKQTPDVVRLKRPLSYYKSLKKGESALHWTAELLEHYGVSRFRCPYTFCCILINPQERWPIAGGRTINGGFNRGGGFLVMSSFAITRLPNAQSTLRHEIAHTCGLPHVDVYGYDMGSSHSVMAYNNSHRTKWFHDSETRALFIPEDRRGLALAPQVFPNLKFSPEHDLPTEYKLFPRVISLGPMELPGHPNYGPVFSTPSGEDNGSKVANINRREILRSAGPGITFRQTHMWASKKQPDGQAVLNVTFPGEITLTRLLIHSEHSGKYNRASGVCVEARVGDEYRSVTEQLITSADATVEFEAVTASNWRLIFATGPSSKVCLRGLQYFNNDQQLLPPPVTYDWQEQIGVNLSAIPPKKD